MEKIQPIIDFITHWYWVPMTFLFIGLISAILIENRNPSKTIAWILVIVFLPIVGLALYYFFGQKFAKIKKIKKENQKQAVRLKKEWNRLDPLMESMIDDIHDKIGGLSRVFRFAKNEKLSSPTLNNEVRLLINGEEKFKFLLQDLEAAKHSIHLEYYIFDIDKIGKRVLEVLERKASEGVHVRLIVDSFGSSDLVKLMRKEKSSKIQFYPFLPVTFTSLANSNYRNHRKIAVIDGYIGYVGGINISDRYINDPELGRSIYWRDTSLRICGTAINMLQISFWNSWNQTDGESFLLEEGYLHAIRDTQEEWDEAAVAFIASDPASEGPFNLEAILVAIGEADAKIQLTTPYYIPGEELESMLIIAASSGVEVELMIPAISDSYIVQHASFSYLKRLLERGVKVYLYKKGFLHAKTITIDSKLSFVGTVNLDIRSFFINYEISGIVSDRVLCVNAHDQFERDKLDCELLTLKDWKKRPRWKRGLDSLCRLLAPLL